MKINVSFDDINTDENIKLPTMYNELTPFQKRLVRIRYIELQNEKCYFCKKSLRKPVSKKLKRKYPMTDLLYPTGFNKHPIHLHHDHNTGLTLGAVHSYCNAILWEYFGE